MKAYYWHWCRVGDLVHCHYGGKYGRLKVDMVVESFLSILTQSKSVTIDLA